MHRIGTHHICLAASIRRKVTAAAQNTAFGQFPSHALPTCLSHNTELFLTHFYGGGGHRNLSSQGRNSVYTTLQSWKSSPLADSSCNSALFCFFGFGISFPHIVLEHKQGLDPTAANRNGATTTIQCLCRDLTWHPHTNNYVPLNVPSREDQTAQQWTFPPSFSCTLPQSIIQQGNTAPRVAGMRGQASAGGARNQFKPCS